MTQELKFKQVRAMIASTIPVSSSQPRIDLNALRTNQVTIVTTVALAFVLGTSHGGAWLVSALAAAMAIGAAIPGYGPIQLFYRQALKPTGLIKPDIRQEDPAPHRFAQTVGAGFLTVSAVALFAGVAWLGWILGAIVVVLALANLVFGFCAGCFVFLQLRRTGLFA
jgi:hypothetical protein